MRKGFLGVLSLLSFALALTELTSLAQPVSGPLVSTNRGVPVFTQTNGKKIDPSPVYIDAIGSLYFGGPGTVIVNDMTTAERNLLSATNGMVIYNTTTGTVQFRQGGAWLDLGLGTGDVGFANFDDSWFRTNGAIVRPALAKTLPSWINVADVAYGATLDGVTDISTIVQQAVNSFTSDRGGTVYIPGAAKFGNILVTNHNVRILGETSNLNDSSPSGDTWIPATATGYMFKIGDGTNIVRGFTLERATLYGQTGSTNGHVGVWFNGASMCNIENSTLLGFKTNLLFHPTGTQPVTGIRMIGGRLQGHISDTGQNLVTLVMPANVDPFVTDIVLDHVKVDNPTTVGSFGFVVDGTSLGMFNCYVDSGNTNSIIRLRQSNAGTLSSYVYGDGSSLDPTQTNWVSVLVDYSNARAISDFVRGSWSVKGRLQVADGTQIDGPSAYGLLGAWRGVFLGSTEINGTLAFNDGLRTNQWDEKVNISSSATDFTMVGSERSINLIAGTNINFRATNGINLNPMAANVSIYRGNLELSNTFGIFFNGTNGTPEAILTQTILNNVQLFAPASGGQLQLGTGNTNGMMLVDVGADGSDVSFSNDETVFSGVVTIGVADNQATWFKQFSDTTFIISTAAEFDSGLGWIARGTEAELFQASAGSYRIYVDTGLTPGVAFSPTELFRLTPSGLNVEGTMTNDTISAGTVAVDNTITLAGKNLWALVPGANVTFSTNVGAKELTINSSGSGGGGSGSGSLQNATVTGSGTDYTITDTYARVDFGAGDPTHTLPAAGTYLLIAHFSQESANTFVKGFKFRDTTASADVAGSEIFEDYSGGGHPSEVAIHAVYTSPGANTVQLWAKMVDPVYSGTHVVWSTNCTFSYVRLDGVLGFSVNAASVATPNFQNTAATGTVPSSTIGVTGTNFGITIGPASATEAGVITTGTQTLAGNKTLQGSFSATNAVNAYSLKVTNTVDIDGIAAIGAISDVESEINGKALSGHTHSFGGLTTDTNAALMAGNFKNSVSEKADIETISGSTPIVNWQTQPIKSHIVTTNSSYSDSNRPTAAAVGESITIYITNSVATAATISLPSGWRDETGIGFTNLVAGQTATVVAHWTGTEVRYYWRTFEYPYDTVLTGAFTLATTDHGKLFNNLGASSLTTYTLPAADAGLSFEFVVADTDGIAVAAIGNDTIRIGGSVTAVAGSVQNLVVGGTLKLTAINSTNWYGLWKEGTWTF